MSAAALQAEAMMRVERTGPSGVSVSRRKQRAADGGSSAFAKALDDGAPGAAVSGAAPSHPIEAILTVQEVADPTSGRARGVRRGFDLLDQLERLRRAMMLGTLSRDQIERLAALLAARRDKVGEPALAELLNEIEVRVAVELAKFGR
jgi:hypothetical protein